MKIKTSTLDSSEVDGSLTLVKEYITHAEAQPVVYGEIKDWQENKSRQLYLAQKIVNKLDSNASNAYRLFRSSGIPVTWPNFFQRLQIRREQRLSMIVACGENKLRKRIINLYEEIQSERKSKSAMSTRIDLNHQITMFNSLITQHGERLELNYQREEHS